MRTVTDVSDVTIRITNKDVLYEEWIPFELLSLKLSEQEKIDNVPNNDYRTRLYNSTRLDKFVMKTFAGVKCVNIVEPMKAKASINLKFQLDV